MKFNNQQNRVLTEIYRNLNYFYFGDLDNNLMAMFLPSQVKCLSKYNFLEPSSEIKPRTMGWYRLTSEGKAFFKNHTGYIGEDTNEAIFEGRYVKDFSDKKITK